MYPSTYLQIYGEGGKREELNALIESLELQDKVFLMGNVSDVIDKIKDAAVFCLPSNYEGLSNALLEAMTLGIPCVSTRCAGADEYIVDGENGFLVEVKNVNALSEKVIWCIENPSEVEKMSQNARAFAEKNFDSKKINETLYNDMFKAGDIK
jgi:glycosyltransferase involved in cell wall biosynthesis